MHNLFDKYIIINFVIRQSNVIGFAINILLEPGRILVAIVSKCLSVFWTVFGENCNPLKMIDCMFLLD